MSMTVFETVNYITLPLLSVTYTYLSGVLSYEIVHFKSYSRL